MSEIPVLPSVPSVDKVKRQQYLVIAGVVVLIAVVGLGALFIETPVVPTIKSTAITRDLNAPGQTISDQEMWIAKSEERFRANEQQLQDLLNKNKELEETNKALATQTQDGRVPASLTGFVPPPIIPTSSAAAGAIQPAPPPPPTTLARSDVTTSGTASQAASMGQAGLDPQQSRNQGGGIFKMVLPPKQDSRTATTEKIDSDKQDVKAKSSERRVGTWVPAGSFTKAIMLGGLDAPTGGQSQTNPHPVLLRLQDNSVLPNRFRTRTKECHLVGAGYGDIASERAYIRLETLSCVLKSGQVIETPVAGYVAGEDGKTGMRGRLVSKQGQLVARGLLAGVLAGIGGGLAQTRTTVNTSALGSTQTVDPSKIFEFGTYQGVGRAMDRLAQYYISMAEKIFPIVEIDASRVVDAVFTKGVSLDGDINNQSTTNGGEHE